MIRPAPTTRNPGLVRFGVLVACMARGPGRDESVSGNSAVTRRRRNAVQHHPPGVPPFQSVFPAFGARSSKVQYIDRKRRSCSPV